MTFDFELVRMTKTDFLSKDILDKTVVVVLSTMIRRAQLCVRCEGRVHTDTAVLRSYSSSVLTQLPSQLSRVVDAGRRPDSLISIFGYNSVWLN